MADRTAAGDWADRLIAAFGGAAPALAASPARLAHVLGDPRAVALIGAHRRAMLWALREPVARRPLLGTRHELLRYLHHRMAFDPVESLRALFLDGARGLIADEVIATGTPAGILVEPRQVLVAALDAGAAGMILVHNHPSGDPAPSAADRRFTRRLAAAAEALGIGLHDHLIVSRSGVAAIDVTACAPT